jgi:hypothetical protein
MFSITPIHADFSRLTEARFEEVSTSPSGKKSQSPSIPLTGFPLTAS